MKCQDCKTKMDQEGASYECPSCGKRQKPHKKQRRSKRR